MDYSEHEEKSIRDFIDECSKKKIIIKIALLAAVLVVIYFSTFVWIVRSWFEEGSFYSHGIFIPIISALIIWRKRNELMKVDIEFMEAEDIDSKIERDISRKGFFLIIIALIMHIFALITKFESISALSFPLVLMGLIMYFLGYNALKILFFPIFFLFFMIPTPWQFSHPITFRLQLIGTKIATEFLEFLRIANIREGNIIYLLKGAITIDRPCSGMRSLLTLFTLSFLYAYFIKGPVFRKIFVVILAILIAFFINIIRIIVTVIIAHQLGTNVAVNILVHEMFGLVVFIFAAGLLYLIDQVILSKKFAPANLESVPAGS